MKKDLKRREFLSYACKGAVAGLTLPFISSCFPHAGDSWLECKLNESSKEINDSPAKVIEVYDPTTFSEVDAKVDSSKAAVMLQRSILELTGKGTLSEAWALIFPEYVTGQKIGIKVNTLNSRVSTRPELVKALVDSLLNDFFIPPENILVWDRRTDELEAAGFTETFLAVPCYGTVKSTADESGPGFQEIPCCLGDGMTYLSKIPAENLDYQINFAVLKNHSQSGITASMKNNYGCIKNPEAFHTDFENDIPILNKMDFIKNKTRLLLVDSILAVCTGDTSSPADCAPCKLLASFDPVAIDSRSKSLIDEERIKKGSTANPEMAWIAKASELGLGSANVDLVQINI